MVTDFRELLEVKIVASASRSYMFKITRVKIDLAFEEEIERHSFLCDNNIALDTIEGFVSSDDIAKKAVYSLMKNGKVSLVEEY